MARVQAYACEGPDCQFLGWKETDLPYVVSIKTGKGKAQTFNCHTPECRDAAYSLRAGSEAAGATDASSRVSTASRTAAEAMGVDAASLAAHHAAAEREQDDESGPGRSEGAWDYDAEREHEAVYSS